VKKILLASLLSVAFVSVGAVAQAQERQCALKSEVVQFYTNILESSAKAYESQTGKVITQAMKDEKLAEIMDELSESDSFSIVDDVKDCPSGSTVIHAPAN